MLWTTQFWVVCYIEIDSQDIEQADTESQSGKCRRWILTYLGSNPSLSYYWVAFSTEKAMATHSSTLVRKIPGTAEAGGLPSTGSHRVGHDWCDLAAAATKHKVITFLKKKTSRRKTWKWFYILEAEDSRSNNLGNRLVRFSRVLECSHPKDFNIGLSPKSVFRL